MPTLYDWLKIDVWVQIVSVDIFMEPIKKSKIRPNALTSKTIDAEKCYNCQQRVS